MKVYFLSHRYAQWLRLLAAIVVALVGLTLVNVTMAQSDASHTGADLSRGTPDQPTSPIIIQSEAETVEFATEFATATGGIVGFVTALDGRPLPRIEVMAYQQQPWGWEEVQSAVTDPSGHYLIPSLKTGIYRLHFLDPEGHYVPEFYGHTMGVDEAADIPVSGDLVLDINIVLSPAKHIPPLERTSTAAESVNLAATSSGTSGTVASFSGISGTVTAPDGTPLSGIQVKAYQQQPSGDWNEVRSVNTNASGNYLIPPLETAIYRLRFWDPSGAYAFEYYDDALTLDEATNIPVIGDIVPDINAVLSPAGRISGTVTMFDGMPPASLKAYVYHHDGFDWQYLYSYYSSNPSNYDVGGLASGVYRLRFRGYYGNHYYYEYYNNVDNLSSATDISVTAGITTPNINVVLGDDVLGRINGTVTANGIPQEGIKIDLYQDYTGRGDWWRLVFAHTDANGNYSIGGLKDYKYRVRFSDPNETHATIYYDGKADLASADTITITNSAEVSGVDATLTGAGAITGTVSLDNAGSGEGIPVVAYRYNGSTWEALGTATTDAAGEYKVGGLVPGEYRLYFQDTTRTYRSEYYQDARSIISGTNVTVMTDTVTPNINVMLDSPAEPQADISMFGSGSVTTNPWTGEATITFPRGRQVNTTIRTNVSCSGESTPTNVTLWMNSSPYSMNESPPGSGVYLVTIPANDITNATLTVRWECNGVSQEQFIGWFVLYDPSGYITDGATGEAVEGATVTLYRVPNWLPDTGSDMLNCRTVDTRSGADWSSEPDASIDLGVVVNPEVGQINGTPEISPTINPQLTDPNGYYGWDVVQGCWYVAVQAQGYETRVSPVVGVPPEVTDLDLELTPYPPVADFTVSAQVGQAPFTVVFTDTSTGTVTDRLWDFGDGGSSEQITLTHTYTEAAVYSVALMVSNPSGSDAMTRTNFITVTDTPLVPDIDVNPTSLSALAGTDQTTEQTLTISNDGTGDLEWTISEESTALRLPDKPLMQENALPEGLDAQPSGDSRFAGSSQAVVIPTKEESPSQMARTVAADDQSLTHSASQEITDLNSIACQNGNDLHRDNSYYRLFDLSADFGIDEQFEVSSVEFGVQLASGTGGEQPVTVNLYTLDGSFVLENLTAIGSAEVNLPDQSLTIASVPVSGTVPAGSTLVVELFTPSGVAEGNSFFIGSNNQGQTDPSYIRAPYCNVSQPTNVTDIGTPQMQLVMNVSGHVSENTCPTSDIPWASLSASTGTTAAGDADEVTVTFDSTGLAIGTYNGQLCIESNDPDEPSVLVPLTLDVEATESVILALSPQTVTTGLGETFELSILVQAGTQEVDGVAAHLNFDPAQLEVVSITPGSEFSAVILNQFDNQSGQLDFAAGNLSAPFPSGTFTLATVTVRTTALTDEDGTPIEFNSTLPRLSDATFDSTSVLVGTIDSTVFAEKMVVMALEPPTLTTNVGDTFSLPILVQAGTQPVDGASADLNFDPTLLEVLSITAGSDLPNVLANSFDNGSGQLEFAADSQSTVSGTFTLATVTFNAIGATDGTDIDFALASDVTYDGTSVLKSTSGSTVTILNAVLTGSVTLQGRPTPPDSRWVVPLRVSLTIPGEDTPAYQFTPTTDESGTFTMTSGITPGTYEIRVKNSHTLQNKQTVILTGGNNTIDFGTLREGDTNDDNYVTLIDFSILVSTFAKCEGDTDYDERADFNSDTCVTLLDFSLLSSNFAQSGQHRPQALAVTPSSDISLVIDQPILNPTRVGEIFIVTVQVQAQTPVDGASAYIHFDESRLKVNSISAGNTFELEIQNQFDNSHGTIDFAAGTLEELKAGHFDLLQIEFEALATNGESPLEFQFTAPRTTDVTAGGTSVLTGYSDGTGTTVPTAVRASQLAAGQSTGLAWVTLLLLSLLSAGIIRWYVVRRQVAS